MADLKKELRGRHLFTLAFGTIIGVGWITVLGYWLGSGSLGALIAFTIGGLMMLTIGLCYAEISSMMPSAGGEVIYAHETFGRVAGFAAGWTLSLIYISTTAFEAISVGWISTVLMPELEGPVIYRMFGTEVYLGGLIIGLIGMFVISFLNYRGAREAASFQDLMTWGLILISLTFIAVGLIRGSPENLRPLFAAGDLSGALAGIADVLIMTPFFFAGFNVLPQAVGEKSPDVSVCTVSRLILVSIVAALVFYVLVILACSMALPRQELLGFDLPAAAAFREAFDSAALGNLVLLAGLLGLITTWNAVVFATARVLLALSRLGSVPHALGAIHPRYGTPSRAVLLIALIGTVLMLLGRGAIVLIVNTAGLCVALLFFTVTTAVIYLRLREPQRERPYRAPGGLMVPLAGAVFSLGMIVISLREHLQSADAFPREWIVLLTWAVLGVIFWLSGPGESVDTRSAAAGRDT